MSATTTAPPRAALVEGQRVLTEAEVLRLILQEYALSVGGLHGVRHWARVAEHGEALARATPGADVVVVRWFALLHDSERVNDGDDPEHGPRAALRALSLGPALGLTPAQVETLAAACAGHTTGRTTTDPTIGCCWDADRLDLGRVGATVDLSYLSTTAGRARAPAPPDHTPGVRGLSEIWRRWRADDLLWPLPVCELPPRLSLPGAEVARIEAEVRDFWAGDERSLQAAWPELLSAWHKCAHLPAWPLGPGVDALLQPYRKGWPLFARLYGLGVAAYPLTCGVSSERQLANLFGFHSIEPVLIAQSWHDGPIWFHGTTKEGALGIMAEGFRPTDRDTKGPNKGRVPYYGPGVFMGSLELAACYGPWVVAAELSAQPLLLNHWTAHEAAQEVGLPLTSPSQTERTPESVRLAFAGALRRRGVQAVNWPAVCLSEVLVYEPAALRPIAALPIREALRRRAELGATFPTYRPKGRPYDAL